MLIAPSGDSITIALNRHAQDLLSLVEQHASATHPFFDYLRNHQLSAKQAAGLLRNYDAHATVLRRLLLKAATAMPEAAVTYILENVRNEYGNGQPEGRHQLQLKSLAEQAGVTPEAFARAPIEPGVRQYIQEIVPLYTACKKRMPKGLYRPAVTAGAITATELMALEEFRAMQLAFRQKALTEHVWFDHVNVEAEHAFESLSLALFFVNHNQSSGLDSLRYGMLGVLDANCRLYDGLLKAVQHTDPLDRES